MVFIFYHMLTFIRYNEVNLTFALVDCVRYNEDLNRSRFVKSRFYSVHFTVILTGWRKSFVIPRTSLYTGSLIRDSTVVTLNSSKEIFMSKWLSLTTQSALEWNSALRTPALHGSTPWCPYQRAGFDCFFKIWRGGGEGVSTHNSRALSLSNSFLRACLGWILTLLVRQQSKKTPLRCVKSVCAGNTKKEKLLIWTTFYSCYDDFWSFILVL